VSARTHHILVTLNKTTKIKIIFVSTKFSCEIKANFFINLIYKSFDPLCTKLSKTKFKFFATFQPPAHMQIPVFHLPEISPQKPYVLLPKTKLTNTKERKKGD
jgi:hypothetical protein